MKKVFIVIYIIVILFLLHLSIRFMINEAYISKSNKGYYDSKLVDKLFILNWPQSYIAYFNRGNNKYYLEDYNGAIDDYEEALKRVNKSNICKVRNNLVLANLKIVEDNIKNGKNCVEEFERIEKIILEDECAKEDGSGKNEKSQVLYYELEDLKNSCPKGGNGGSTSNTPAGGEQGNEENQKEKELEGKINEQQQQTQQEREKNSQPNYNKDDYNGKRW